MLPMTTRTAARRVQQDIHRATINLIQGFAADVSIVAQGGPPGAPNERLVSTPLCATQNDVGKR